MKRYWKIFLALLISALLLYTSHYALTHLNLNRQHHVGEVIDSLNGVAVYYNGGFAHVEGRNLTKDGYNLGLKYQCVEFVKRYYYEHYDHKMPDSYGHAKSFFDKTVADGALNKQRGLVQYKNGLLTRPREGDLLVYSPTFYNRFGHVAIVAEVTDDEVVIIQQNPGPWGSSRERFPLLKNEQGGWEIGYSRIIGFLRMPEEL